jgi:hypothetical protein
MILGILNRHLNGSLLLLNRSLLLLNTMILDILNMHL